MNQAIIRFLADLNYFLPASKKNTDLSYAFEGSPSVKHVVESLGIPHTEVAHMLANGLPVDFAYHLQDGDLLEVYPISDDLGERSAGQAPQPEGEPRFILDLHLGRLAAYLRMLGFDSLYRNDYQDQELADTANREDRILLTRDRRLLMRSVVKYGYSIRSRKPAEQLQEVVKRYRLSGQARPFQRCLRCNTILQPVRKEAILERLEPLTRRYYDEFHICPGCGQIYWRGSHYNRMIKLVESIR